MLVSPVLASAQTFTTPDVVNMSKSYLTYNYAQVDLSEKKLKVGNKFSPVELTITFVQKTNTKQYYIEATNKNGEVSKYSFSVVDKVITKFAELNEDNLEDWALSQ